MNYKNTTSENSPETRLNEAFQKLGELREVTYAYKSIEDFGGKDFNLTLFSNFNGIDFLGNNGKTLQDSINQNGWLQNFLKNLKETTEGNLQKIIDELENLKQEYQNDKNTLLLIDNYLAAAHFSYYAVIPELTKAGYKNGLSLEEKKEIHKNLNKYDAQLFLPNVMENEEYIEDTYAYLSNMLENHKNDIEKEEYEKMQAFLEKLAMTYYEKGFGGENPENPPKNENGKIVIKPKKPYENDKKYRENFLKELSEIKIPREDYKTIMHLYNQIAGVPQEIEEGNFACFSDKDHAFWVPNSPAYDSKTAEEMVRIAGHETTHYVNLLQNIVDGFKNGKKEYKKVLDNYTREQNMMTVKMIKSYYDSLEENVKNEKNLQEKMLFKKEINEMSDSDLTRIIRGFADEIANKNDEEIAKIKSNFLDKNTQQKKENYKNMMEDFLWKMRKKLPWDMIKEEGLASMFEKLVSGIPLDKINYIWVGFPPVVFAQILAGEDNLEFQKVYNKLLYKSGARGTIVDAKWRLYRYKRWYFLDVEGGSMKDTSYGVGLREVQKYLQEWLPLKYLYGGKISIDDVRSQEFEPKDFWMDELSPFLVSNLMVFMLQNRKTFSEGRKQTIAEFKDAVDLKEKLADWDLHKNFIKYMKEKYTFLAPYFDNLKESELFTRVNKYRVARILNIVEKNKATNNENFK